MLLQEFSETNQTSSIQQHEQKVAKTNNNQKPKASSNHPVSLLVSMWLDNNYEAVTMVVQGITA